MGKKKVCFKAMKCGKKSCGTVSHALGRGRVDRRALPSLPNFLLNFPLPGRLGVEDLVYFSMPARGILSEGQGPREAPPHVGTKKTNNKNEKNGEKKNHNGRTANDSGKDGW